eukprot:828980-Pyramimonas_sp.AAC.1
MVADCRRSNEVFTELQGVRPATGDAFGTLEMIDVDDTLRSVEGADLKGASRRLQLPGQPRSHFALGPARA